MGGSGGGGGAGVEAGSQTGSGAEGEAGLGPRLRQVRELRGLSVRELARRVSCSASLISQIERGLSAPSVGVLYALATELGASLDYLFGVRPASRPSRAEREPGAAAGWEAGPEHSPALPARPGSVSGVGAARVPDVAVGTSATGDPAIAGAAGSAGSSEGASRSESAGGVLAGLVQRADARRVIDLASGVRWERLTRGADDRVDFLEVIYQPGGHSTDSRQPLRHDGYEYGVILSGRLWASIGFDSYELGPGDSIAFDSAIPHEYWNTSADQVHAVWVVVHDRPGLA